MKRHLLAALAVLLAAGPAAAQQTHVSGRISKRATGSYEVYEPFLNIRQSVNAFGSNGFSFHGWPFSGHISGSRENYTIFGGGVHATVSGWGGSWRVHATAPGAGGRTVQLFFTLRAEGREDDPRNPPSYSVWDSGVNLRVRPWAGGGEYDMSGWVDPERFGAVGTSLVGLVAAAAIHRLEESRPKPQAGPAPLPAPLKLWQRPPVFH